MSGGKCGSVLDAAQETLVLAFKVGEATLLDSPQTIEQILKDPAVRKAIESAATAQAKELVKKQQQGARVSGDDVLQGAKAVGKSAAPALQKSGLQELEKSAKSTKEYRQLEQSLKELECAWKQSPVGVWVDKHKGLLYIVGAGLALQGAVVMYRFKAGDAIAGPATNLAQKLVKFKVLGNVEIAAKKIHFVPSKQEVGARMLVTATWDQVKLSFEAGVTLQGDSLKQAGGQAELAVKVTKGLSLSARGGYQYQAPGPDAPWKNTHQYDLGLGLKYNNAFGSSRLSITTMMFATQDATVTKYGGTAGVNLRLTGTPSTTNVNITASGAAGQRTTRSVTDLGDVNRATTNEVAGKLGVSVNF